MFKTPTTERDGPTTLLAAVAGVQAPWIEALSPDTAVLFSQTDARRQLWFAVGAQLALHPERIGFSLRPVELTAWLASARAIEIVRQAGLGTPPGWQRSLGRLGPFALEDPSNYLHLFDILAEGGSGAGILRHATRVTETLIEVLAAIEPELRRPALVRALFRCRNGAAEAAQRWMWRLTRLRDFAPEAARTIEAAVLDGAAPTELLDEDGVNAEVPLPLPPWPGTKCLRPLQTASEMADVGRRYHNCVGRNIHAVRSGEMFYYEFCGGPEMIVELKADLPFGWVVYDACLANNKKPTLEDLQSLGAEFTEAADVYFSEEYIAPRCDRGMPYG